MVSLIKSKDRVRDVGEVFTPDFLVEQMLDQFPASAWDKSKNWLEPTCGNGQFILGILRRKLARGHSMLEALNTTFGADIMADNISECHMRIYKEIVLPQATAANLTRAAWNEFRWRIVCIVNTNIKRTKDSLAEDFSKWVCFSERPEKQRERMKNKVQEIFYLIDHGNSPTLGKIKDLTRSVDKVLFRELSALKRT